MDAFNGSQRLQFLAQHLRLYRPPSPSTSSSNENDKEESAASERVGITELVAATIPNPTEFRPKRAAVLICIFEDNTGDLRVILTKRSANLSSYSGQVSLPGGMVEEGDVDDSHTATREAKEEIGLEPSLVTVVTVLEPFVTKRFLIVVPVVGILSDKEAFKPVLNTDEVEAIFDVPLDMFLKDENQRSEKREYMGIKYLIHFFDVVADGEKYLIWGLTAWILIHAASIVFQQPPSFREQRPHFKVLKSFIEGSTTL